MQNQFKCGAEKTAPTVCPLPLVHKKMASSPTQSGRVTFHPSVQFERETSRRRRPTMAAEITAEIFKEFESKDVTDEMLAEAARLFSEHYGTWDTPDGRPGGKRGMLLCRYVVVSEHCKWLTSAQGTRVKLNATRLRRDYLPDGVPCPYVTVHIDNILAGNAFACRWTYQGRQVCWVTQLVVHDEFRERRLATRLLEKLRKKDDEIFGIMSSHPAALIAIAKACAGKYPHSLSGLPFL